jgi:hypothetical protein
VECARRERVTLDLTSNARQPRFLEKPVVTRQLERILKWGP